MQIKRETIALKNEDINIKINIPSNSKPFGFDGDFSDFANKEAEESINEPIDYETRRFVFDDTKTSNKLYLEFNTFSGIIYLPNYLYAGFTIDEVTEYKESLRNSYYIFELYDSLDVFKKNKISTTYLTKLDTLGKDPTQKKIFNIIENNQIKYLNIPLWFIEENIGKGIITGYTEMYFYNAKLGSLSLFFNTDYFNISGFTTNQPKRMLFKTIINLNNKTWYFDVYDEKWDVVGYDTIFVNDWNGFLVYNEKSLVRYNNDLYISLTDNNTGYTPGVIYTPQRWKIVLDWDPISTYVVDDYVSYYPTVYQRIKTNYVWGKELITNQNKYSNKLSDNLGNFNKIKQRYPESNYFDNENRTYSTE
jgi:hypothetical protein